MFFSILHIIHIITVVVWIGGLSFITLLILPLIIDMDDPLQKALLFQRIEHKFAPMARIYNIIVGISGFVMVYLTGWYKLYPTYKGLPLLIMTLIWVMWFIMLFGLEPVIIRKMLDRMVKRNEKMEIENIFRLMNRMHFILLLLSFIAIIAGVAFGHSYL